MLTWTAGDGAIGYNLEYGWNGKDFHPLVNLPPGQTQYEDFTALPNVTLSYRLQPGTSAGAGDWLRADASTPAASPHPIAVNPTYDDAKMVKTTIGKSGGSVSLTDAAGVEYKLDIPAGALAEDTEIQLTPLTGLDGWPLDGERLAAVRIDPAGLQLAEVGMLTITLTSSGNADLATVGFAFKPTGDEFHLESISPAQSGSSSLPGPAGHLGAPVPQTEHVITLPVIELTGHGAGQGSTSAITDLARNNAPSDAGAAADQRQAAADAYQDDLAPLVLPNGNPPPNTSDPAATRLEKELVNIVEQVDVANDGDALGAAMKQFQKWQEGTEPLTPDAYGSLADLFWDHLTSKFMELLDKAAKDCEESSGNPPPSGIGPLQQMIDSAMNPPSISSQWSVLKSKMASAYGEYVLGQAWFNLKQGVCGSFQGWRPEGVSGIVCSLVRPFKLEMREPASDHFVEFFPETMTKGFAHVRMTGAAMLFTGFGRYSVEFFSPTDANIKLTWTGTATFGGRIQLPNETETIRFDLQHVIAPDCP
jgi:hypothetical protein